MTLRPFLTRIFSCLPGLEMKNEGKCKAFAFKHCEGRAGWAKASSLSGPHSSSPLSLLLTPCPSPAASLPWVPCHLLPSLLTLLCSLLMPVKMQSTRLLILHWASGLAFMTWWGPHVESWPQSIPQRQWYYNRRELGRAQLLKEWHSPRTQHKD